jgi:hypothetical protein
VKTEIKKNDEMMQPQRVRLFTCIALQKNISENKTNNSPGGKDILGPNQCRSKYD